MKFLFLKRLIPSISRRILKLLKKNRGIFRVKNTKMFLDFLDSSDRRIILNQEIDVEQISILNELIKKHSVIYFFDVGANCGYYSITLAKNFKNLKILAFEPNNDAYFKFNKTLNINPDLSDRIILNNYGLSNKNLKQPLKSLIKFGYPQTGGSTVNNYYQINFKTQEANFKIGDEEFNIQGSIIAFKIDVEGHEINVLNGIKQLLNNNKCVIQIEIFDKHFEQVNKFLTEKKFYQIAKAKHITVFSELFTVSDYFYTNIK